MSRQLLFKPDVWGDAKRHADSLPPVSINLNGLALVKAYARRARARRIYANNLVFPPYMIMVLSMLGAYYVVVFGSPATSMSLPFLLAIVSVVPPYYVWCWSQDNEGLKVLIAVIASFTVIGNILTAAILFNQSKSIAKVAVP